jgi:hypothetical protein
MNWDCGLWLELQGRWVDSDAIAPEASIGPRILLPPGSFSNENEALGLVNINPANDETGQRGDETIALDLSYGMLVDRPIYDAIPPGAIQPMSASQPLFTMNPSTMQRNPCPGYKERVYLYCTPGQPFQASAVLYTDISGSIASVELFDQKLRKLNSDYMRRCWVSLYR